MTRVTRRRTRDEVPSGRKYAPADVENEDDEEFEEEEETPRRSRRSDSGSERPRFRTRENRQAFDEGAEEGTRRPAGRRGKTGKAGGGWNALANAKTYSENLSVGKDDIIVKFLEDEPYAVFKQHWIQEVKASKKSYYCPDDDCPLCELGDRPRHQVYFNVLDLSNPEKPTVKTWSMGKRLAEKIHGLSEKPRTTPIDREDLYWAVSKSGEGTSTEYNLQPVKADDLYEWFDENTEVEPLSKDELAEYMEKCQTSDDVYQDSLEALEKVADEIS